MAVSQIGLAVRLARQSAFQSAHSRLSELLELDAFVAFVNTFGPQIPRRMTKNDAAFEKQLVGKKPLV